MSAVAIRSWPSRFDISAALAIALLVFALEAYVAAAIGRTDSLAYDGLGYAAHARVKYFQLLQLLHDPVQYLGGFLSYIAGLWSAFLVLTYAIAGVGEMQSFFGWFWYLFFLLILVIWVARATGGRQIAVLLAGVTALLPLCSPMLALAISYEVGNDWMAVMEANLADARPDPLAHVFMLWSVVPLIMHGRAANAWTFAFSASAVAASVLTKGTTGPLAVGCWGLAILYVLWLQRDQGRRAIARAVWSGALVAVLLLPWAAAGGMRSVLHYIRDAYAWMPFYQASTTEAGLHHFGFHRYFLVANLYFPWWLIAAAAVFAAWGTVRAWRAGDRAVLATLAGLSIVAAGILLPLYVQKLRNHYLGMPLYFVLWIYAVIAISSLWRGVAAGRMIRLSSWAGAAIGATAVAVTALLGSWSWPQDDLRRLREGRQLVQTIASDIRAQLEPSDAFAGLVLASGWPLILQFHMTTDAKGYPASFPISPPAWPRFAEDPAVRRRFLTELETNAKLIVTFKEDPAQVYRQARMSDFFLPFFGAIHTYLNSGESRYRPVREYVFPEPGRLFFPPAASTVVLYLRDDVPTKTR